jgi:hypothetical protein
MRWHGWTDRKLRRNLTIAGASVAGAGIVGLLGWLIFKRRGESDCLQLAA